MTLTQNVTCEQGLNTVGRFVITSVQCEGASVGEKVGNLESEHSPRTPAAFSENLWGRNGVGVGDSVHRF